MRRKCAPDVVRTVWVDAGMCATRDTTESALVLDRYRLAIHYGVRCSAAGALGVSVLVAMFVALRGNQQVLAWPVAVWMGLLAWPGGEVARPGALKGGRIVGLLRSLGMPLACVVALCVSITFAANAVHSKPEASANTVRDALSRAERLTGEGQLREALTAMEALEVPSTMPLERARKHHDCGVILIQLGRPELAVEHLLMSLKYDRTNAQAAYLLAVLAADRGRLDEATMILDMAIAIRPDFQPARRLREKLARRPAQTNRSEGR